jgi:NAD(P)-dependent dehydrogenase (short-subunit alcohol dehydrogenase family)
MTTGHSAVSELPEEHRAHERPVLPLEQAEVEHCLRVLERLVTDPNEVARVPEPLLRALRIASGRLSRPTRLERERVTKAIRRYERQIAREADLDLSQTTAIREGRLPRDERDAKTHAKHFELRATDCEAQSAESPSRPRVLNCPRNCYVCKRDFTELHFFYDCMCPGCADHNYRKRSQTTRLDGCVAVVTGGRIKIGYYTSIMLLRAGASVVVTTRFPHDSAARYALEPDFDEWKERLTLYGLDLRHIPSVERFTEHLDQTLPRLDFLINNAAQTVQRPPDFFAHLLPTESRSLEELPEAQRVLLAGHHQLFPRVNLTTGELAPTLLTLGRTDLALDPELSKLPLPVDLESDHDHLHFPKGRLDADGQQIDLRRHNSWRMKAHEVGTPELIEVHLVNAIAPFILCSRLKSLMERTPGSGKHIVNVSAMEGVFARFTKSDRHPHTNMAKASLNMLTRTSAKDYLTSGINMNSVDTGWVTDEDPHHHAVRKRNDYDFHPPLDSIDGAARVCDPIFSGHTTGVHASGLLFKDYAPIDW